MLLRAFASTLALAAIATAPAAIAGAAPVRTSAPAQTATAAAAPAPPSQTAPSVAPSDVASPDAIIAAAYAAISGPAGAPRDEARIRALFLPEARFVVAAPRPGGGFAPKVYGLDEFLAGLRGFVATEGFFERGIANRAEQFGNIAHVFSSYESRHDAKDARPFARGVNSFQLLNDGGRWWILSVYWQQESASAPIPDRYLKNP